VIAPLGAQLGGAPDKLTLWLPAVSPARLTFPLTETGCPAPLSTLTV